MEKMTIQEIASVLVEKNGLTAKEASRLATEFFAVIKSHLEQGDQVKVKGLGTFKVVSVEARESISVRTGERVVIEGHDKIGFTPDTVMRELVNKPFSQFETVVLNDGVEFSDLKEEDPDDEKEESPVIAEESPVIEDVEPAVAPIMEVVTDDEPPVVEDVQPEEPEEPETPEFPESPDYPENPEQPEYPEPEEPGEEKSSWLKWLLAAVVVLALMAASAFGGYYYAMQTMAQQAAAPETAEEVQQEDTLVAEPPVVEQDTLVAEAPVTEAPVADVTEEKAAPVEEKKPAAEEKKPAAEEVDKYSAKDERVRLGAYRIVGTAEEVTVLPGQTFYSICRAHLGPDMQCYVEVYNDLPRNPDIKAGQTLKIPKLELKKKRKH